MIVEPANTRGKDSHLGRTLKQPAIGWAIVGLGAILRLRRYLEDRGLMHDDAQLARNIFAKSFLQLLKPLDQGDQAAPVGFLFLQKSATLLFGRSEWSLRLVPFLAAVIALPIFYRFIRKIAPASVALLGTAWLALAEPVIRYSAEAKQYSTDVLWCSLILWLTASVGSIQSLWVLGMVGTILIWFSHPLLLVLGGVGITLVLKFWRQKNTPMLRTTVVMGFAWLASFCANFLLISRFYVKNDYLNNYWKEQRAFAPLPISKTGILWYPLQLEQIFDYPLGIWPSGHRAGIVVVLVGIIMFVAGACVLARRRRSIFCIGAFAILLTMVASGLQKYPFGERLTLFTTPLFILPLAFGVGSEWPRRNPALLVRLALCAILFAYPLYLAATYLVQPEVRYDAKPGILYVRDHCQPGDTLFLPWGSTAIGTYYLDTQPGFAIPQVDVIRGDEKDLDDPRTRFALDLQRIQGKRRVWVLFSMDPNKERGRFEEILNNHGREIQPAHKYLGGTVDLYDLSTLATLPSEPK